MKFKKNIFLLHLLVLSYQANAQIPIGYENGIECAGIGEGDIISFVVFFNDNGESTGDCISNDWIAYYTHVDGTSSSGSSFNPNCIGNPSIDCYTTIDFNTWNCCSYTDGSSNGSGSSGSSGSGSGGFGGSSGGGGGSPGDCIFAPDCSGCGNLDEYISCEIDCGGC